MIPRSISASALNVAEQCLARYKAENIDRVSRGSGGSAALLGTSCHAGLEEYVKACYIEGREQPGLELLLTYYKQGYIDTFDTADAEGDVYDDGIEMLTRWYERTSFEGFEVISAEIKETFDVTVPDAAGNPVTVPFNYIWDRVDRISEREIRVVDYKSQRWAWSADEIRKKPQARLYGLAAQIKWPEVEEIWVDMDFLRHDNIGVRFTKADNTATWLWLKRLLKKIVDTDGEAAPETINTECKWCVRKAGCETLKKNIKVGGTLGLPLPELIDRRLIADMQIRALKSMIEEADEIIEKAARNADVTELSTDQTKVTFARSSRRAVDADRAEKVLGPVLWAKHGSKSLSVTTVDKLIKSKELTPEQKRDLKSLISVTSGEPRIVTKPI